MKKNSILDFTGKNWAKNDIFTKIGENIDFLIQFLGKNRKNGPKNEIYTKIGGYIDFFSRFFRENSRELFFSENHLEHSKTHLLTKFEV